ncbi:YciI family protein [Actinoallomurus purpureus]|uniref:YciI family protein n=1 Tax=Actinoallomurus purpureus TaxID=478114 RepID=UPI0020920989|nr:YciI family protein [Actinoallomurus purpureus]MCO6005301.1 YciI family protein [Actinoallomurus purpureus]
MQFLLVAYDGTDDQAIERRLRARAKHVALGDEMVASGQMLYGTAILDDHGKMIGSMVVLDFPAREDLDAWLAVEPYMVGDVWKKVEVRPCRVGPSFTGLHH